MDARITPVIWTTVRDGQRSRLRQFQLNIEPADRIDELKLDVTAPMIAARPSNLTTGGTARAKSRGMVSAGVALRRARTSACHGYENAAIPIRSGGTVRTIVRPPAMID